MRKIGAAAAFLLSIAGTSVQGQELVGSSHPAPAGIRLAAAPAQAKAGAGTFSEGDLSKISPIPAAFGPFQAKTSGIGVYRGRLNIAGDDLKKQLFVVVRVQNDPAHKFGWMRVFANNKLVATEAGLSENRIVQGVEAALQAGDVQVSIMGMAYPGTNVDFYLVPKDLVLPCLQNPALGTETQQKVATVPQSLFSKAPPAKPLNITKILPQSEVIAGKTLEIQGDNFNTNVSENRVYFGSTGIVAKSLRSNWLAVDIPRDFPSGTYRLVVDAGQARSKPVGITIVGYPRVKGVSALECLPDSELSIDGDNFPEIASLARVSFGSIPARVLQSNRQRILVKVPNLNQDASYPIKVTVGQLSSTENVNVKVGNSASASSSSAQEPIE